MERCLAAGEPSGPEQVREGGAAHQLRAQVPHLKSPEQGLGLAELGN